METGDVVRLMRGAHTVVIGQIRRLGWRNGVYLAKLHNYPLWVPVDQLVPLRSGMS